MRVRVLFVEPPLCGQAAARHRRRPLRIVGHSHRRAGPPVTRARQICASASDGSSSACEQPCARELCG